MQRETKDRLRRYVGVAVANENAGHVDSRTTLGHGDSVLVKNLTRKYRQVSALATIRLEPIETSMREDEAYAVGFA